MQHVSKELSNIKHQIKDSSKQYEISNKSSFKVFNQHWPQVTPNMLSAQIAATS